MEQIDYDRRFHEALSKAFAARSSSVRAAYFDLAAFYREKLGNLLLQPSSEVLHICLSAQRSAVSA